MRAYGRHRIRNFGMTPETLRADAMAGLLGAVLALPQGIAFATLAGLPPEYGIYTAIVPCAVAAVFGSSRHVVSGPTNANSLALFASLSPLAVAGSPEYIAFALAVTVLVGIIQFGIGALKFGWVTDFIAPAVLIGFMAGAAALIGFYALPDFFGLNLAARHGPLAVLLELFAAIRNVNASAAVVGLVTLVATLAAARISRKLPFMLIGLAFGFAASELLARYSSLAPVARIGALPSVIPPFHVPVVPPEALPELLSIAGALSIVALGQSVSIAKALARRSGQHLDIDREIRGQGLSNIVGGFFSSYLSCGSLNRSSPNLAAGARTPMAAVLSAVFIIILASASRPLLESLPMPAIAALLLYVAFSLFDLRGFVRLARLSRPDFGVAIITFLGMFVLPFQHAIMLGSGLSLLLYLNRTAHPGIRTLFPDPSTPRRTLRPVDEFEDPPVECPQLKLIRIEGSVYFGAAGYLPGQLHRLRASGQKHLLVMAEGMNFIDLSGAEVWDEELRARRAIGGDLYFHRPRTAVRQFWTRIGFDKRLGPGNIFTSKVEAIATISTARLDRDICAACKLHVFGECTALHAGAGALRSKDEPPLEETLSTTD